jgi:hypothetical protein
MYDLTINIETEQSGQKFVPTGIQENLRLGKPDGSYPITYEKSKNGSEFIALHFLNDENQTLIHTEFEPSDEDETKLAKKQSNLVKRLLHIGKKLVDEASLKKIKATSFEELARSYISVIGNNYANKLFRGKVVYNNKNFTTFPNYVPFIESMSVPLEQSNLKMSPDDKVVKSRADVIITKSNPFADDQEPQTDAGTPTDNVKDLPF